MTFPAIPEGDLPDRRADPTDKSWHVGLMVTQDRAIKVAQALFPDERRDGSTCMPDCSYCAEQNATWIARVRQVRQTMMEAFK